VLSINTDDDGMITAKVRNISASVDNSVVSLVPLKDATNPAVYSALAQSLFGWRCGNTGDGTTVAGKYLPGSCRG
jgi:type IV pilus assembly protein PilA